MDCNSDPCRDFHQYACGGWIGALDTPKPTAASGLIEVTLQNIQSLDELFVEMVREKGREYPPAQFFLSCIAEPDTSAAGLAALTPVLTAIEAVDDAESFLNASGMLATIGVDGPFVLHVTANAQGQNALVLAVDPMGDRPEHARGDDEHVKAFVHSTFVALGESPALAQHRLEALQAVEKAWRRGGGDQSPYEVTAAGLAGVPELAPLAAFVDGAGLPPDAPLLLDLRRTVRLLPQIAATDALGLRTYLRARVVDTFAAHAGRLRRSNDALEIRLAGFTSSREDACRTWTGKLFSEEIDRAWLAKHFDADARDEATALFGEIVGSFERRLSRIEWLTKPAIPRARARLMRMRRDVGYPDHWLAIDRPALGERHLDNLIAMSTAEWKAQVARLGRPVDDIWVMPAHLVNAYYVPMLHAIEVPAAVLQPPLFATGYPRAYGFGAMGSIIGHELTHAFDVSVWLAAPEAELPGAEVVERRRNAEECVVRYYDATLTQPPYAGRGKKIVREAMADIGGLRIAYDALGPPTDERGMRGLTREQLFFVAFAQTQCMHPMFEETLARVGDDHAPASFRVNGSLAQLPEFAAAFSCAEGTPMNPADRCEAW